MTKKKGAVLLTKKWCISESSLQIKFDLIDCSDLIMIEFEDAKLHEW